MDGLPVTIRLIDPPLHEFLPDYTELSVKVALEDDHALCDEHDERLLEAVKRLHEQNPMLGLRGVRLGIVIPGLFTMQVRAILEAAADRIEAGGDPHPEIMIPLVAAVTELDLIRGQDRRRRRVDRAGARGRGRPQDRHDDRAAPRGRDRQRDREVRGVLLVRHQRPDPDDVGLLARRRRVVVLQPLPRRRHLPGRARSRRSTSTAWAGSSGTPRGWAGRPTPTSTSASAASTVATPTSIHFFDEVGLDYVSCSPFRVPVARLEAGRSALDR